MLRFWNTCATSVGFCRFPFLSLFGFPFCAHNQELGEQVYRKNPVRNRNNTLSKVKSPKMHPQCRNKTLFSQKTTEMQDIKCVHGNHDHGAIENVYARMIPSVEPSGKILSRIVVLTEVYLSVDNATCPTIRELTST